MNTPLDPQKEVRLFTDAMNDYQEENGWCLEVFKPLILTPYKVFDDKKTIPVKKVDFLK